jgi:hypothetical protein
MLVSSISVARITTVFFFFYFILFFNLALYLHIFLLHVSSLYFYFLSFYGKKEKRKRNSPLKIALIPVYNLLIKIKNLFLFIFVITKLTNLVKFNLGKSPNFPLQLCGLFPLIYII